jgi:beta-glucosidase
VKAILERIAEYQPQAITLLMPILPCGEQKDDPRRLRVERINALIKPFADGRRVVWFDIRDRFLTPDGGIRRDLMPDFQHPLGKGYGIWRDALQPYFKSICKR